jgi:hypothetical protein
LLRRSPLNQGKLAFAWRSAVGAAVDRVTAVTLDGDVLMVRVRDAAWQREVERSAPLIRSRLAHVLGADVVRRLDVRVG